MKNRILILFALSALAYGQGSGQSSIVGNNAQISGTPVTGNCASWANGTTVQDAGAPCGTGSGTVTSVSGTTNQIAVATGTTTPVISLTNPLTLPGPLTAATGACNSIAEQFGSTSTVGLAQGATTGQIGMTNGTLCSILFAISNTPTIRMALAGNFGFSNTAGDSSASLDTNISRVGPGLLGVGKGAQAAISGLLASGNKMFVTSDFTTAANTSLQTITGLTVTLPASTAVNFSFHCALNYSQATANAAVAFGIQGATTAPTNINADGTIYTSTTASTTGTLNGLASTAPTNIVSATPSAITTVWKAELDGTIEAPSNASPTVVNWMVSTATSGDAVTVKRGSYCVLY